MAIKLLSRSSHVSSHYFQRTWMLYLMLVLPIAFFAVFRYIPMTNIVIAFKNYNIFQGVWASNPNPCPPTGHTVGCSHWVGFQFFQQAFQNRAFYSALRNTIVLNVLDLLMGFPAPIILAIILNEIKINWYKRIVQTIVYMPHFLSWIIISAMATMLLAPGGGVINIFLLGMGLNPINFLMDTTLWVFTYVGLGIWRSMGWGTIIYLAAIAGINPELYEAAEADGAGRFRKIWHVTLPGIRSTAVVLLILNLGTLLGSEFDRPFNLQNARVMRVADVISTFVYRVGIRSFQFSYTAAIGLFQSVICVLFLVTANAMAKKFGERGIW